MLFKQFHARWLRKLRKDCRNKCDKNTIFHVPNIRVINTANTDKELKVSHHIIVLFGFHLSANVPPIKEKMKIGANSATEIIEIAKASPLSFPLHIVIPQSSEPIFQFVKIMLMLESPVQTGFLILVIPHYFVSFLHLST